LKNQQKNEDYKNKFWALRQIFSGIIFFLYIFELKSE
jgi:hypothetical protein